MSLEGRTVVLGISGGIAAFKTVELVSQLKKKGVDVHVMLSESAAKFVSPLSLQVMSGNNTYPNPDSPQIEHIELADKADIVLIAPATANTMAKMVTGMSDEMIFDVVLATKAPVVVAPAMNTNMWEHATTKRNLSVLKDSLGYSIIDPEPGDLACGYVGQGRLAEIDSIISKLEEIASGIKKPARQPEKTLAQQKAPLTVLAQQPIETSAEEQEEKPKQASIAGLSGKKLIVTVGATRENIDPVRFLTNRSSGKMGFAIAREAVRQGMEVCVITTIENNEPWTKKAEMVNVSTHEDMYKAIFNNFVKSDPYSRPADALIMVAAVSDYRPLNMADNKLKKSGASDESGNPINAIVDMINNANDRSENLTIELEKTPDILQEISRVKQTHQIMVGFSVETENVIENAKSKVQTKDLDFIVANSPEAFDADETEVSIIGSAKRSGQMPMITSLPKSTKDRIANKVLEYTSLCFSEEIATV